MLSKKEFLEIGFSYKIFSHNIPCVEIQEEIINSIYKELKEENVNLIVAK